MIPTFAICPVRNEWDLTRSLIWSLDAQTQPVDDLLILDNGSTDYTPTGIRCMKGKHVAGPGDHPSRGTGDRMRPWLHRSSQPGKGIYPMWDFGMARARRLAKGRPFNLLVVNNDVQLHHDSVQALASFLRDDPECWVTYPDYDARWEDAGLYTTRETHGVYGDGGMSGSSFLLKGEAIYWAPLITDPMYQWWWGDAHLAECIEAAGGKQLRVVGLPVKHIVEGTAQHHPELYNVKLQDRGRWVTRHQRGFGVAP